MKKNNGGYSLLHVFIYIDNMHVWTIPYEWHHMQLSDGKLQKWKPDDEKKGTHQVAWNHQATNQTLVNATKD